MHLIVAAVGKLKAGPTRALYEHYAERVGGVGKSVSLSPLTLIEVSESRRSNVDERYAEEGGSLLAKVPESSIIVALDEKGKGLNSTQFAEMLRHERDSGTSTAAFLIGGPDGHGADVRQKAQKTISLGAITLPHGLARVVLAEQLYRAATILAGHPYHRN